MEISWQPAQPAQPAHTQLGRNNNKNLRLGVSWESWASCQLNSQSDGVPSQETRTVPACSGVLDMMRQKTPQPLRRGGGSRVRERVQQRRVHSPGVVPRDLVWQAEERLKEALPRERAPGHIEQCREVAHVDCFCPKKKRVNLEISQRSSWQGDTRDMFSFLCFLSRACVCVCAMRAPANILKKQKKKPGNKNKRS